jgi:hypothetical protein
LGDYPIPDPDYFTPQPPFCSGVASSQKCLEPNSMGSGSVGQWGPPPSTGGTNRLGAYPLCARPQDINNQVLDLSCLSSPASFTIYPGQYTLLKIPGNTTATMSHYCFGDSADPNVDPLALATPDMDCINNARAGVYYFSSNASNSGLYMTAGSGSPSSLTGCGVLAIFDPNESGGSRVQLNVGGAGNTLAINPTSCNMKIDQGNGAVGTTPFVWYGYNDPFTNPVSIWVRKTGGYSLTNPQSGSHVITMGSGSTIQENGVIYAPEDNTIVSGGPLGSGVGQIVAWTITYVGNSTIDETYQGPGLLRTRLWQ